MKNDDINEEFYSEVSYFNDLSNFFLGFVLTFAYLAEVTNEPELRKKALEIEKDVIKMMNEVYKKEADEKEKEKQKKKEKKKKEKFPEKGEKKKEDEEKKQKKKEKKPKKGEKEKEKEKEKRIATMKEEQLQKKEFAEKSTYRDFLRFLFGIDSKIEKVPREFSGSRQLVIISNNGKSAIKEHNGDFICDHIHSTDHLNLYYQNTNSQKGPCPQCRK